MVKLIDKISRYLFGNKERRRMVAVAWQHGRKFNGPLIFVDWEFQIWKTWAGCCEWNGFGSKILQQITHGLAWKSLLSPMQELFLLSPCSPLWGADQILFVGQIEVVACLLLVGHDTWSSCICMKQCFKTRTVEQALDHHILVWDIRGGVSIDGLIESLLLWDVIAFPPRSQWQSKLLEAWDLGILHI